MITNVSRQIVARVFVIHFEAELRPPAVVRPKGGRLGRDQGPYRTPPPLPLPLVPLGARLDIVACLEISWPDVEGLRQGKKGNKESWCVAESVKRKKRKWCVAEGKKRERKKQIA